MVHHPVLAQPRRQQRKQWSHHARREPDILAEQHINVIAPLKMLFPPQDVVVEVAGVPLPRMSRILRKYRRLNVVLTAARRIRSELDLDR